MVGTQSAARAAMSYRLAPRIACQTGSFGQIPQGFNSRGNFDQSGHDACVDRRHRRVSNTQRPSGMASCDCRLLCIPAASALCAESRGTQFLLGLSSSETVGRMEFSMRIMPSTKVRTRRVVSALLGGFIAARMRAFTTPAQELLERAEAKLQAHPGPEAGGFPGSSPTTRR